MLRVTADTNILVSALVYRRGKPFHLLTLALDGVIRLTVSQAIIDEMAEVLTRKFDATTDEVIEAKAIVSEAARTVDPSVQLNVTMHDPPDNRILECAVSAGSSHIVSGDKDLLRLGSYDSIRILSVSDFLDLAVEN